MADNTLPISNQVTGNHSTRSLSPTGSSRLMRHPRNTDNRRRTLRNPIQTVVSNISSLHMEQDKPRRRHSIPSNWNN